MDQNRILVIGPNFQLRGGTLLSNTNLYEFGAAIWYPSTLPDEWVQLSRGSTTPRIAKATEQRLAEVVAWIRQGHVFIIVGEPPRKFSIRDQQINYQPLEQEPFTGISFERGAGRLVEFCGPLSAKDLLDPFLQYLSYNAILKSDNLTPLLKVSRGRQGGDQLVGGIKKLGAGTAYPTLIAKD